MSEEIRNRVLRILEQYGGSGVSQGELVEVLGYSKSWISEVLKELEERGLVSRIPGPGKTKRVVLSKYLDPSIGKTVRIALVKASEYVYLQNFMKYLRSNGYTVELVLYRNVSDATAALSRAEVHLAITPIYTQAAYRALGAPIRTYPGGALGGASIVYRELGRKTLTSRASTMEVATVALHRVLGLRQPEIYYYEDPEKGIRAFLSGAADALAIWEPYSSKLEAEGYRRVRLVDYVGDYYCCTLARHENLNEGVVKQVENSWIQALRDASRGRIGPDPLQVLGLSRDHSERAVSEYRYTEELEWGYIKNVLDYAHGFLLNQASLRELLE